MKACAPKTLQVFRLLPKSMAADVFSYMSTESQQALVEYLADAEVSAVMNDLFVDDLVDFIEEIPAIVVNRVLASVDAEKRRIINEVLRYPEDSAGSVMTTEFVYLFDSYTVRQAIDVIRETGVDKETIYTCYVIDPANMLIGQVSADALIHANPNQLIAEIMETNVVVAHTTDDQEAIANLFSRYGLIAMPVVDSQGHLVGIVTIDDVMRVIEEETTEDFEKMAAVSHSDVPYLKSGVIRQTRNRVGWLMLMMLSDTINGTIIGSFEESLSVIPLLGAFIPMLMGAGGNASNQTSTVVIRGMAVGDITFKDAFKVIWKELRVGLACGLTLGVANFIRIYLMNGRNAVLSFVVTVSLLMGLTVAKTLGCMLPMLAKRLGVDPAVMAAPMLTTLVDCTSLLIYFTVCKLVLGI